MSSESVCRLCLATEAPLRAIVRTPLQGIYEKLTDVSLDTSLKPIMACSVCYCQLIKCHKLMSRSLRADQLLNTVLNTGTSVRQELIARIDRASHKVNYDLSLTPVHVDVEIEPIEKDIKNELYVQNIANEKLYEGNIPVNSEEDADGQDVKDVNEELIYEEDSVNDDREGAVDEIDIEEIKLEPVEDYDQLKDAGLQCDTQQQSHAEIQYTTTLPYQVNTFNVFPIVINKFIDPEYKTEVIEESLLCPNVPEIEYEANIEQENSEGKDMAKEQEVQNEGLTDENNTHEETITERKDEDDIGEKILVAISEIKIELIEDTQLEEGAAHGIECDVLRPSLVATQHTAAAEPQNNTTTRETEGNEEQSNNISAPLEKCFGCEICQERFNVKSHLVEHLIRHPDQKSFKCTKCPKTYKHQRSLNHHLKIHFERKPYKCSRCRRRFKQKSELNIHLTTHSRSSYGCATCERRYKHRKHLVRHLRSHSGDKVLAPALDAGIPDTDVLLEEDKRLATISPRQNTPSLTPGCVVTPIECERSCDRRSNLNRYIKKHCGGKSFEPPCHFKVHNERKAIKLIFSGFREINI